MKILDTRRLLLLLMTGCLANPYPVKAQANIPTTANQAPALGGGVTVYKPGAYATGIPLSLIRSFDPQQPYMLETDVYSNARTAAEVAHTTQYVDGLGRPLQTVGWQASPSGKDIVASVVYDAYSREQYKFLPYTSTGSDGTFKADPFGEQSAFYGTTYTSEQPAYTNEKIYYSQVQYEASPLNRILTTMASGNSWAGNNKGVQQQYLVNDGNDLVRAWDITYTLLTYTNNDVTTNIPTSIATYAAGQLSETVSIDEHNNQVIEYKDNQGHTVLKKVQIGTVTSAAPYTNWLCTFYVYDDLGRLRFVIPPKAVALMISAGNWTLTSTIVNELCFRYEYDDRQRMIAKKVPGAGWVYMVYDQNDRLVFVQDANMRVNNQWMGTIYDGLSRPIQTGVLTYSSGATSLQAWVTANTGSFNESNQSVTGYNPTVLEKNLFLANRQPGISIYQATTNIFFENGFISETGAAFSTLISSSTGAGFSNTVTISDNPLPKGSTFTVLTITNYDNYSNTGKTYDNSNNSKLDQGSNTYADVLPMQASVQVKGMVTSSKVRVIENATDLTQGAWLETANFYDDKGRVIQVSAGNYKGGTDVVTNRFNFINKVVCNYLVHNNASGNTNNLRVKTNMDYDAAGRLKTITKQLNDDVSTKRLICRFDYDATGQMKRKQIGQKTAVDNTAMEDQSYAYNIRGWLKGINWIYGSAPTSSQVNIQNGKWFGMDLGYDWGFNNNQYNGNIGGSRWVNGGDGKERAYGYDYDAANRLLKADFKQNFGSGSNPNWANTDPGNAGFTIDFSVKMGDGSSASSAYDENGNIKQMQQWGLQLNASPQIDNLNYTYQNGGIGNKLRAVSDGTGTIDNHLGDFTDKNTTTDDYGYDLNGNMITDLNKRLNGNTGNDQTSGGAITYNFLNLPWQITVKNDDGSAKGSITYIYDATGNKLEKRVNELASIANGNTPKQTNTAYLGSFVYENSVLQFFGHEEGRIRTKFSVVGGQPATAFVYDYFLKDHLGNTRVVLTDEQQTDAYMVASLETTPLPTEKLYYSGLDNGRVNKSSVPGYPTDTYTNPNDFIQQLSGAIGANKTGSNILLKVMAGDKVNVRVNSWYNLNGVTPTGYTSPLTDIVNALINSVPGVNGNKILQPQIAGTVLNANVGNFLTYRDASTLASKPKAYINIVLLDEQLNPVLTNDGNNSYFEQVGGDNVFTTHNITGRQITKSGYLYIYISNETQNVNVFFDNLQVTHVRGPLLETTDYYPFGLSMSGISCNALNFGGVFNKVKYNGVEKIGEFDLQDYDTKFRELNPQTGIWWQIDPKIEKMENWSPYISNFNNPILYCDPLGDFPQGEEQKYQNINPAGTPEGTTWDNTQKESYKTGNISIAGVTFHYNGNTSYRNTTTALKLTGTTLDRWGGAPTYVKSVKEIDIKQEGKLSTDGKVYSETTVVNKTTVTLNDLTHIVSVKSTLLTKIKTYSVGIGSSLKLINEVSTSKNIDNPDLSSTLQNRVERAMLINDIGNRIGKKSYSLQTQNIYDQAEKSINNAYH